VSIAFTNSVVGANERRYLRTLPAHIRVEFQLNSESLHLLLVHGSPRKINEYLCEDRDEKSLLRIMETAGADILCFGHTHKPYHRVLEQGDRYRHAVNTGSVGKPKDGDSRGCYVLLHLDEHSSTLSKESIRVEFIRFEYDVDRAAKAIEDSVLPDAYADMLRTG
jgi:diadenosine tetraphosphatase ApaH/serine/threonine PP2A family protein phosphatase